MTTGPKDRAETAAPGTALVATSADVAVAKVTDHAEIAGCGIASTPGVVVGGKVVPAAGPPKAEQPARPRAA